MLRSWAAAAAPVLLPAAGSRAEAATSRVAQAAYATWASALARSALSFFLAA